MYDRRIDFVNAQSDQKTGFDYSAFVLLQRRISDTGVYQKARVQICSTHVDDGVGVPSVSLRADVSLEDSDILV
jgi:hypothetical protein